jgi:beta-lactamase regulating signal transducer with metallopeptidase domain
MHPLLAISQFIAQAFVAGLWQGLALIAAVAILLRLVPRVSAAVRFAIWAFAFVLAATIPLLHLPAVSVLRPHAAASAMVHLGASWGFAIASIWVIFMLARGAQLLMHAVRLRRIWRHARPVPMEDPIHSLLQRSGRRAVEVCTSTDVDSPSVIGFFSPRLLIPEWLFAKLAPSDLQQIVLHECEHLRRGDDWINLLQKVGVALFPLNPALLWVDRRLSLERELACDAGVVASTTAPFAYAHCLTRLAEHRLHRRSVALSLSAWSRQSELARRVHHLLRPVRNMSPLHARFAIALICAGLGVGAVQMARAPRLFSFTDPAIPMPIIEAATTAPETAIAQSLPVVYRQEAQPRAAMVNAVLPLHKSHRAVRKSSRRIQPGRNAHTTRLNRPPRIVLTTVELPNYGPSSSAGGAYIQPIRFSPSYYAAVPFGDGWLVIQL